MANICDFKISDKFGTLSSIIIIILALISSCVLTLIWKYPKILSSHDRVRSHDYTTIANAYGDANTELFVIITVNMLIPEKLVETIKSFNGSTTISGYLQNNVNNSSATSATIKTTNFAIDCAIYGTFANVEGGYLTIFAQDKETWEMELIIANFPLIPDRSYIILPDKNIALQKFGYGHFIDEIGRNWFPFFNKHGSSNGEYCQNDCARRGWKANWCLREQGSWQYCSVEHGYDAYNRKCLTDCGFYGEEY